MKGAGAKAACVCHLSTEEETNRSAEVGEGHIGQPGTEKRGPERMTLGLGIHSPLGGQGDVFKTVS